MSVAMAVAVPLAKEAGEDDRASACSILET